MKLSLLFCFLFLFAAISCGSDNDDNDNDGVTVTTPANPDDREEEEDNTSDDVVSKYTAVVLKADGLMDDNYTHTLRADLGRRPVILTGNFSKTPIAEDGSEGTAVTCNFAVTLTEAQADRLERLGNRLRVCSHEAETGDEIVDFESTQVISLTDTSGATTEAFKSFLGDFDMEFNYLCGGRSAFYSNMKALVKNKIPETCPPGALTKF